MPSPISEHHPLRTLFAELVHRRLLGTAHLDDVPIARYIANLLTEFCHVDNLYKIRDSRAKRLDSFVDYLKAGKESYSVVAAFDQFEYSAEAPLFRRLSDNFEICVYGLNLVKQDLDQQQNRFYQEAQRLLS